MKKFALIAGAALAAFAASLAVAQTISVPKVAIIGSTDLIQVIPGGAPSAQSKYAYPNQITSQMGYQKKSPVTGFTYSFGNADSLIALSHSTTLAEGTITFAAAPSDGAQECVYAQNTVTTLNLAAGASTQTIVNAVTTIGAAAKICYLYSLSDQTWTRSK